jgi:enoyl-CoA hydratase/carnithine racemase
MTGTIRVERADLHATVWIDNVAKRNAMSADMWVAMADAVESLSASPDLRCIVLRGAGTEAFGSGADISEFAAVRASKEQAIAFGEKTHRAFRAVRDCPLPIIAAIRGACVGGGLELAAFCDMRICTSDSRFGVPIARLGAILAYPELEGLMRLAGPNGALEILLEGRVLGAAEALGKNLVTRVVEVAQFDDEVAAMVRRICAGAPLSARWHKKFVARMRRGEPLTPAELEEGYACFGTEDYRIGYESFLAKETPKFVGR